jgi:hypothetical protein
MVVATKEQVDAAFRVGEGGRRLRDNEYILDVENMLVTNMKEAMLKLGGTLAKNLSKNAPVSSGKLSDPETFYVDSVRETKTGFRLEIKVGVDYYDYIDKGVRGIRNRRKTYPNADGRFYQFKTYGMPIEALQSLEGWMKRKNMEIEATNLRIASGDETVAGRQMLPQISSSAKRLAYYIKKYGIEGRQFIKQSINESTPQFNLDIKSIGSDSLVLKISK